MLNVDISDLCASCWRDDRSHLARTNPMKPNINATIPSKFIYIVYMYKSCVCVLWVLVWLYVELKQRHKYMNSIIYFNPVLMVCKHFVCSSSHFQLGCSYFIHVGALIRCVYFMYICWICVFILGFYDGKTFANANKNRIASNLLLVWLRVFVRVVFFLLSLFLLLLFKASHRIMLWIGKEKEWKDML